MEGSSTAPGRCSARCRARSSSTAGTPDALPTVDPAVVEVPELRARDLRVPLAELVAEGEDPLLRTRFLLVAAATAEQRVELVLLDRVEQRRGLQLVATRVLALLLDDPPGVDRLLDAADLESYAELLCARVPEVEHLLEVVPGVDVQERNGMRAGQNDFSASRSITRESLPPENSSTGRSSSAATSRKMWTDSASSIWSWESR